MTKSATGLKIKSMSLTDDKYLAMYLHMFVINKNLGIERPFDEPLLELEYLSDTDIHLPVYQRSKWAITGKWGVGEYGSRWPARFWVSYV